MREKREENIQRKRIRTARTILWTAVVLIQMSVVHSLEVRAETTAAGTDTASETLAAPAETAGTAAPAAKQLTVRFEIHRDMQSCTEPDPTYLSDDGVSYELDHWKAVPVSVPARSRKIERAVLYEDVEGVEQLPETIEVRAQDEMYGQTVQAECTLKKKETLQESWQDGFVFPVTFHTYGAGEYRMGEHLIPANDERPDLAGCEEVLLELAGVPAGEYRVTDIRWAGDPYEDETGTLCRDASATGEKLLRNYRAVYGGTAVFPAFEGWQTMAVYRLPEPPEETVRPSLPTETPAAAPPAKEPETANPPPLTWWQRITQTLLVTVAAGAVLFLAGLLALVLVQVVKKARSCYNRGKINRNGGKPYVHRK